MEINNLPNELLRIIFNFTGRSFYLARFTCKKWSKFSCDIFYLDFANYWLSNKKVWPVLLGFFKVNEDIAKIALMEGYLELFKIAYNKKLYKKETILSQAKEIGHENIIEYIRGELQKEMQEYLRTSSITEMICFPEICVTGMKAW